MTCNPYAGDMAEHARETSKGTAQIGEHLAALIEVARVATAPAPPAPVDLLAEELAAVRGELVRVDGKCGTFASVAGLALGFVLTQSTAPKAPVLALVFLGLAAVPLVACALLLISKVLRPRLGATGFVRYARMDAEGVRLELEAAAAHDHRAAELVILSGIAARKNRALQRGSDLLAVGLVLVALAILAGVIA